VLAQLLLGLTAVGQSGQWGQSPEDVARLARIVQDTASTPRLRDGLLPSSVDGVGPASST
jgi:hypothetical protein